jgi:integrase
MPAETSGFRSPLPTGWPPCETPDDVLVFASPITGRPYDPRHLELRVLSPACSEAGVEWAGLHTFRHTVASRLFADDRNAVEVQKWLGHHSPSFTLDTYVHLLDGDLGAPLEPLRVGALSGNSPENDAVSLPSEVAD